MAETYAILTTDAVNLRRDLRRVRTFTIQSEAGNDPLHHGVYCAFKCGLWWRDVLSLLPDFVAPVALMFCSDKVTVVGKGNGGLHPTCAHVRRPWAQPPRGLAGAVGLNCEDQRGA